ncbi:Plasmodium exported protein, unknown function [Plasmodium relictum]|uniref:Plasmodium RESA N-terminal domain-containing protein n=1 Tax=Plasmodium relictum TaxID=85471 RepID=A0A1J1GKE3_PLARL|nr:Plasmodium exported protein, unknown function [Plasmodium relictum]CRG85144.1 Plasmodium exported protein, unknown function [Plasmodium relictum]
MNMKNYSTHLDLNREGITKKRICAIPILLKLFTMLYLIFLFFLLECLSKQEILCIYVIKFNKDHLRILAEMELKDNDNLAHIDTLSESFFEFLKKEEISLKSRAFQKWEEMCFFEYIRCSLHGRSWEEDKFQKWYDQMQRDIDDFRANAVDEYKKLKENSSTDEECSKFFIMKKKEWTKYKDSTYKLFKKYVKDCKKEWDKKRNKKKTKSGMGNKMKGKPRARRETK